MTARAIAFCPHCSTLFVGVSGKYVDHMCLGGAVKPTEPAIYALNVVPLGPSGVEWARAAETLRELMVPKGEH